ncbi:putative ATP synthase subunit f, mitochondrial [Parasteatoda tepidariorum]|uniref:putative ATP synthase subunit f, mitochondrial n=1 Tax=Parasteatoda tepidariorum TaxID=114398 RepID=UPI00077F9DB9|nr:putative ATP synthase subunit f, mitochondrial [Parasteatoda tepidariorum]
MVMNIIKNFGRLPAEYNVRKHGPYDPSVFYGKKDTPFGEVKLGELGSWVGRRQKNPAAIMRAVGRAWWRWQFKYLQPRNAKLVPLIQCVVGIMALFYVINYEHLKYHCHYKYHW